jgi:alpha-tubulin suppressor-like RCC1 family protein
VTTDYHAYCWGYNLYGQVGDGSTNYPATPSPVAGGHQFFQVETNGKHTCGVSYPDRRAYCWGTNSYGELGDNTQTNRLTPVAVAGSLTMRQVSVGYDHTCGVTTNNLAYCWGYNRYGQNGDSSRVLRRVRPSRVAGAHQFRSVDAGADYTCAVTTGDVAFCWGNGSWGQLGNGTADVSFWPRAVAGGIYFTRVTAGLLHTCGETRANLAYCWGHNTRGQLGDGTGASHLTPVPVRGGLSFKQVSVGGFHTCGKTATSVAYCWGWNAFGQLGDGSDTNRSSPVRVAGGP